MTQQGKWSLTFGRFESDYLTLRWVYKRIFVADGNFKADHVRQENGARDVWLSEGGGMMAKRDEYHAFLRSAIERLTVCSLPNLRSGLIAACRVLNVILSSLPPL